MNAETAGHAGTPQLKQFLTVNIDMFRHPKYYKELRKRNRAGSIDGAMLPDSQSDQAISHANSTRGPSDVRPGPGLKLQAPSVKLSNQPVQATSDKRQAQRHKLQAPSHKQQAH